MSRASAAIGNVASILGLLIFVYGVLGVNLFGCYNIGDSAEAVNAHANFSGIGIACITLFRIVTGEEWQLLLLEVRVS